MRRPVCLCGLTFVAALILCMQFLSLPCPDLSGLDGRNTVLEGRVCRKEYRESSGRRLSVLYLKQVSISDRLSVIPQDQIKGVMCYMKEGTEPITGSLVRMEGKARCFAEAGNPGEFDERSYYRTLGVDFRLYDARVIASDGKRGGLAEALCRLKNHFASVLSSCFEEKEASIMKALLLGEKSGLDPEVKSLYRRSGIIHILSISGLHISLLGMGFYRLLLRCRLKRGLSAFLSAAGMFAYTAMTGMSVSAVRAVVMFSLYLMAQTVGRTYDMLTALSLSAVGTLLMQPRYADHSGFLFSYGAVAALGALLPAIAGKSAAGRAAHRRGKERKALALSGGKRRKLWKDRAISGLSPGIAVALATLPVHLYYYFSFPVSSILLNLLVIPLMSVVLSAGLLCMLFGGLFPHLTLPASYTARAVLRFYESCCRLSGWLPFANPVLGQPGKWQIAVYVCLFLCLIVSHKKTSAFFKAQWVLAALAFVLYRPVEGLRITVLDVGQGDCIHIAGEDGSHYLIDGGSSSLKDTGTYQILPCLKAQGTGSLRAVWVTHSDADHCNGILTLLEEADREGVRIENLILPDLPVEGRDGAYQKLEKTAGENRIRVLYMSRGQYLTEGRLRFTCLHPQKGELLEANAGSLVLRLTYGSFSALFTGDLEGEGEKELLRYLEQDREQICKSAAGNGPTKGQDRFSPPSLSLLKVAHHGSGHATGEELLSLLSPRISFISCGKDNSYGHPHPELLERLSVCESKVYITKDSGALTLWTDGKVMRVKTFKDGRKKNFR